MASDESKPFLYDVLESSASVPPGHATEDLSPTPSGSKRWRTWVLCVLAVIVELAQLGLIVAQYLARPDEAIQCQHVSKTYSPANDAISFENRTIWTMDEDFMAPPGEKLDESWSRLLEGTLIRISEEEMSHLERDSVVHLHNGGYAAGLGVGHDLHCLKRVSKYVFMDHYYPGANQAEKDQLRHHVVHCIDSLRRTLLCHPDTSVLTLRWDKTTTTRPAIAADKLSTCVDWDRLHSWMKERAVNQTEMIKPDGSTFEPAHADV